MMVSLCSQIKVVQRVMMLESQEDQNKASRTKEGTEIACVKSRGWCGAHPFPQQRPVTSCVVGSRVKTETWHSAQPATCLEGWQGAGRLFWSLLYCCEKAS